MYRRDFLLKSSIITTGIAIAPFGSIASINEKVILNSPNIMPILWSFARTIGYGVITALITDYVKEYLDDNVFKSEVISTQKKIEQKGYTNYSGSQVYSNYPKTPAKTYKTSIKDDNIFYEIGEEYSVLVPFHDMQTVQSTNLKYPSVLGITQASSDFCKKYGSSPQDAQINFLPKGSINEAIGSIKSGYSKSELYRTQTGTVEIGYKSNGNGLGTIRVIVKRNTSMIFDMSYDMGYNW